MICISITPSDSKYAGEPITALVAAAEAHDRSTFVSYVETIDWAGQQPEDLVRAVNLALQLDLAALAVRLARHGGRLFPAHQGLQQLARVLAPPVVRASSAPPAQDLDASREWLRNVASKYHGKWVAVRQGRFLGAADTLRELMTSVRPDYDPAGTIITKVV